MKVCFLGAVLFQIPPSFPIALHYTVSIDSTPTAPLHHYSALLKLEVGMTKDCEIISFGASDNWPPKCETWSAPFPNPRDCPPGGLVKAQAAANAAAAEAAKLGLSPEAWRFFECLPAAMVGLEISIIPEPKWGTLVLLGICFPCFEGFTLKTRGHLGSRTLKLRQGTWDTPQK